MIDIIKVLHVDDELSFLEISSEFLERKNGRLDVVTETSADDALDTLEKEDIDCVVSDYHMPGMNGVEFLEVVHEEYPDLPFILFTGKGSEEIASEAVSKGVTDYLQKRSGTEQYELLANRVVNAVGKRTAKKEVNWHQNIIQETNEGVYVADADYKLRFVNNRVQRPEQDWIGQSLSFLTENGILPPTKMREMKEGVDRILAGETNEVRIEIESDLLGPSQVVELQMKPLEVNGENLVLGTTQDVTEQKERERELEKYEALIENSSDITTHLDADGTILYVSPSVERVLGYENEELVGDNVFEYAHPDDSDHVVEKFGTLLNEEGDKTEEVEFRFLHADGSYVWLQAVGSDQTNTEFGGIVINSRDVTERKEYEDELERQNERLDEFSSVVSHDLRSPLTVAEGRLEMAQEEVASEHLNEVEAAHDRMETLIEDLLTLASEGTQTEAESVELGKVFKDCWQNVETDDAMLVINTEQKTQANLSRLKQLCENLMRNAVEHGGDNVTVTLGELDDGDGFYVADDGPGIPQNKRQKVFEKGYSTSEENTGFGLRIVEQVAEEHSWKVDVTESEDGGARFEFSDVEPRRIVDLQA